MSINPDTNSSPLSSSSSTTSSSSSSSPEMGKLQGNRNVISRPPSPVMAQIFEDYVDKIPLERPPSPLERTESPLGIIAGELESPMQNKMTENEITDLATALSQLETIRNEHSDESQGSGTNLFCG